MSLATIERIISKNRSENRLVLGSDPEHADCEAPMRESLNIGLGEIGPVNGGSECFECAEARKRRGGR